jgi:hypothetical protein
MGWVFDTSREKCHLSVDFCECHADMSKWDETAVYFSMVGPTGMLRNAF